MFDDIDPEKWVDLNLALHSAVGAALRATTTGSDFEGVSMPNKLLLLASVHAKEAQYYCFLLGGTPETASNLITLDWDERIDDWRKQMNLPRQH